MQIQCKYIIIILSSFLLDEPSYNTTHFRSYLDGACLITNLNCCFIEILKWPLHYVNNVLFNTETAIKGR